MISSSRNLIVSGATRFLVLIISNLVMCLTVMGQGKDWADSTLSAMTIEEKVGQLFVADLVAVYSNGRSPIRQYADVLIRKFHVGGFVLAGGTVSDIALMTNALQQESPIPLLINADLEGGLTFSHPWEYVRGRGPELPHFISGGGTAFTSMMAVGATGNPENAYTIGTITARECRAIGIHWTNSPVADVNINPRNPIINTRSFGEDPSAVAKFVEAYVRGVQEGGVLATLKHFPGHGDTEEDTHMKLPVLQFDEKRLLSVELVPFKAGIDAGVKSVMTAHISLPKIDPTGRPSTLSYPIITGLLRERLGFHGIVITDGMTMQGITDRYGANEAAVLAVEAGADCILVPDRFEEAFEGVIAAVHAGRISVGRLDASVRRILQAKSWLGLDTNRYVPIDHIAAIVGSPESDSIAQSITDAAVTLLRNRNDVVPLHPGSKTHIVTLTVDCDTHAAEELNRVLTSGGLAVRRSHLFNAASEEMVRGVLSEIRNADIAVLAVYLSIESWKGQQRFSPVVGTFLTSIARQTTPVVVVAFGDPYVIENLPLTDAVLTPFDGSRRAERSVGKALLGKIDIRGTLPVTIPGRFRVGEGIRLLSKRDREGQ